MPYPWLTYAAVLPHCLMRGCGAGITLITDDSEWLDVYQLQVHYDVPQLFHAARLPFPEPDNEDRSATLTTTIWAADGSVVLLGIHKQWWRDPEFRGTWFDDAEVRTPGEPAHAITWDVSQCGNYPWTCTVFC